MAVREFDWDDIRLFLKLYHTQSMSKAAQLLNISQSTISRRLSVLEECLGARLFERTPNGLLPTQAANDIVGDAEAMDLSASACGQKIFNRDNEVSGTVRLAIAGHFAQCFVIDSFRDLHQRYPRLSLEYVDSISPPDMTNRHADILMRLVRPENKSLIVRRVATLGYGIYAHRDLAVDESLPLEAHPWVAWVPGLSFVPDCVWMQQHSPKHRAVVRATDRGILLSAALSGVGLCMFPNVYARVYSQLKQVYVDRFKLPEQTLWLGCHRDVRHFPRIEVVWKHLLELAATLTDK